MERPGTPDDSALIRMEQAGLWWVRLRDPALTADEIGAWLDWCQSDPANVDAFERIENLGGRLTQLDPGQRDELVQALLEPELAEARSAQLEPPVAKSPQPILPVPGPSIRHRRGWALALAASLCLILYLVLGVVWVGSRDTSAPTRGQRYITQRAQQQDIRLADGSQVALGARSTLQVNYEPTQRRLGLDDGEAYFQVAPNPQRPFVVLAGGLQVTAVGTAFNIRKTGGRVEVAVLHGTVDVRDTNTSTSTGRNLRLVAGQQVLSTPDEPWAVRPASSSEALAWRSGSMGFVDEPLSVVVDNVNRYAQRTVLLADSGLADLRYTGTVVHGREADWLTALQAVFPLRAETDGQGRILLIRVD